MTKHFSRRSLFKTGTVGFASLSGLFAFPTESSGSENLYTNLLFEETKKMLTEDNILGPFYRNSAPIRAKVTPPNEPGDTLLIKGCVYGLDTQKPLGQAVIDIWQADHKGHYDNDDPKKLPAENFFKNRVRIITDTNGRYEYETIKPGPYKIGKNKWRPSHIHYLVQRKGYKKLITQLYFKGDANNATDQFIKKSLIVDMKKIKTDDGIYEEGHFDIVLGV